MVKFSKQLEAQLVPEWGAAYVAYKLLKKDLKQIKALQKEKGPFEVGPSPLIRVGSNRSPSNSLSRMHDSIETFLALAGYKHTRRSLRSSVILVNKVEDDPYEIYETVLADPTDMEGPFFARLDAQFNTVNKFYKNKENEVIAHANILEKQLKAFADMREAYVEQRVRIASFAHSSTNKDRNDVEAAPPVSPSQSTRWTEMHVDLSVRNDLQGSQDGTANGVSLATEEVGAESIEISSHRDQEKTPRREALNPRLRMRVPITTPRTTISTLYRSFWEDFLKLPSGRTASSWSQDDKGAEESVVTKKHFQLAEKMLRAAFVEYYRGLGMLKSYSSLNMVAFAKILKKHDKISGQRTASLYLKTVECSYFNTSDKIIKLMDAMELLFTKHFAKSDRQKAMLTLRPGQKRASHNTTFALGLFSGGSLALLVVFGVLVYDLLPAYKPLDRNSDGSLRQPGNAAYFETVFPAFSMLALILIHLFVYGGNLYFWRRMRINYSFIFGFQPGTELRHRQVLMITSILTTLLIGAMVGQLALHATVLSPFVDLIPFALFAMMLMLLLVPLNICYRSSRVFLLSAIVHILSAPLYKVVLTDFFLADQLTSQVPMLRNLEYTMCYYLGGYFRTGNAQKCRTYGYRVVTYIISLLPYWWRLMQCVRRFVDEADRVHVANGGKYLSALVAVAISIQYTTVVSNQWRAIYIVASAVATIYQLYWDLVQDWGLLRKHSKNRWLRDRLSMPTKQYIYFLSMILNAVLRVAWVQSVTSFQVGNMNQQATTFIFASLEVIRRGQWNFYRLENEHLNNVGKYRATKPVPLPFEAVTAEED